MPLKKYVVGKKLMNSSIGIVKEIVYDDPRRPNLVGSLPLHVVVEFKKSTLDNPLMPGNPSAYIPILIVNDMCENKYCTICNIPLRICEVITLYKIQGLTVGPSQVWEKVIIWLPIGSQRKTHGEGLTECSSATGDR